MTKRKQDRTKSWHSKLPQSVGGEQMQFKTPTQRLVGMQCITSRTFNLGGYSLVL